MLPQFRIHADVSMNLLSLYTVLQFCYMIWPAFIQLVFTEYLCGKYLLDTSPPPLYSTEDREIKQILVCTLKETGKWLSKEVPAPW